MATNELQLAKAFRDAGFPQDKAEAVSQTIFDAIRDNVATKADVELVRRDLAATEQALRSDLAALRSDMTLTEQALRGDLTTLRSDMTLTEQRLRTEIQSLKVWGGGTAVAAVLATITALHYWPPR